MTCSLDSWWIGEFGEWCFDWQDSVNRSYFPQVIVSSLSVCNERKMILDYIINILFRLPGFLLLKAIGKAKGYTAKDFFIGKTDMDRLGNLRGFLFWFTIVMIFLL